MANLLRTEWYKLWHSWYFWGIGIFTFLLSSILLLDSKGKTSNLVMTSYLHRLWKVKSCVDTAARFNERTEEQMHQNRPQTRHKKEELSR